MVSLGVSMVSFGGKHISAPTRKRRGLAALVVTTFAVVVGAFLWWGPRAEDTPIEDEPQVPSLFNWSGQNGPDIIERLRKTDQPGLARELQSLIDEADTTADQVVAGGVELGTGGGTGGGVVRSWYIRLWDSKHDRELAVLSLTEARGSLTRHTYSLSKPWAQQLESLREAR